EKPPRTRNTYDQGINGLRTGGRIGFLVGGRIAGISATGSVVLGDEDNTGANENGSNAAIVEVEPDVAAHALLAMRAATMRTPVRLRTIVRRETIESPI